MNGLSDQPISLSLGTQEIEETTIPSKTYKVHNNRIIGTTDGLDAIRQAVEKILLTQLFEWEIYSEVYGIESDRLIGQSFDFVRSDIERTIEDALFNDDRIESIENFQIVEERKESMHVSFRVISIEGSFEIESEVQL